MDITILKKLKEILSQLDEIGISDKTKYSNIFERVKSISAHRFGKDSSYYKGLSNLQERVGTWGLQGNHIEELEGKVQVMIDAIDILQSNELPIKSSTTHSAHEINDVKKSPASNIEIGDLLQTNSKENENKTNGKIFISHTAKDKNIVNSFCELILDNALGMDLGKSIFNTSLEGSRVTSGKDFRDKIKVELTSAKGVLQFISKDYKKSEVCLNEMGAVWVLNKTVIPLMMEPDIYDVGFINNTTEQIQLSHKEDILRLIDDHTGTLFPGNFSSAKLNKKIDEFLKLLNERPKEMLVHIDHFIDGAKLNQIQQFTGTFEGLPNDCDLVSCVVVNKNMFYPQQMEFDKSKKTWKSKVVIGEASEKGGGYEILIGFIKKYNLPQFDKYWKTGNQKELWKGISFNLEKDFAYYNKINVIRI